MYTKIKSGLSAEIINEFKTIVGENFVLYDEEALNHYAHDETENLHYLPDVVIKPRTAQEISARPAQAAGIAACQLRSILRSE